MDACLPESDFQTEGEKQVWLDLNRLQRRRRSFMSAKCEDTSNHDHTGVGDHTYAECHKPQPSNNNSHAAALAAKNSTTQLSALIWSFLDLLFFLYASLVQRLGFGLTASSCYTAPERRFLCINARKVEAILLQPSVFTMKNDHNSPGLLTPSTGIRAASLSPTATSTAAPGSTSDDQTETPRSPTEPYRAFQLCPVLRRLGDEPIPWDLVQQSVFLASEGRLFAERYGIITDDDYLLIAHRLVQLSEEARATLVPWKECNVATYWRTIIDDFREKRMGKTAKDLARCIFTPTSLLDYSHQHSLLKRSDGADSILPIVKGPIEGKKCVIFSHGLVESSVNWIWSSMRSPDESAPHSETVRRSAALALACDEQNEVWLCNNRGNHFSSSMSEVRRTGELPIGWKDMSVKTVRGLATIYKSRWEHDDMCTRDLPAIYDCIRYWSPRGFNNCFKPHLVAFSQSCRILLESLSAPALSWVEPQNTVLVAPPLVLPNHEINWGKFWRRPWAASSRVECFFWVTYGNMLLFALGVVEPLRSLLPARFVGLAGDVVVHMLGFSRATLSCTRFWMSATPSSLTSRAHLHSWQQFEQAQKWEVHRINALRRHGPVKVFVPLGDTIVDGEGTARALEEAGGSNTKVVFWNYRDDPHAHILAAARQRSTQTMPRKASARADQDEQGTHNTETEQPLNRLTIVRMPGMSHLDPTWSLEGRPVHQDIITTISQS